MSAVEAEAAGPALPEDQAEGGAKTRPYGFTLQPPAFGEAVLQLASGNSVGADRPGAWGIGVGSGGTGKRPWDCGGLGHDLISSLKGRGIPSAMKSMIFPMN